MQRHGPDILISDSDKPITFVAKRPGGGVQLVQSRNFLVLNEAEADRLIEAIRTLRDECRSATPAKARLMRYPVSRQSS
jgi:hypothetical protein